MTDNLLRRNRGTAGSDTTIRVLTTVVAVDDSLVVLTSRRQTPFSLQQLLSLGIDPTEMRMIVVKAAVAYRAAYEPIAGTDY